MLTSEALLPMRLPSHMNAGKSVTATATATTAILPSTSITAAAMQRLAI
jgi:hypothetical protein